MAQDGGASPSQPAFVALTVKNTFIDFQTFPPPDCDPPTCSAPANMGTAGGLSRLFRKKEPLPAEDSLPGLPERKSSERSEGWTPEAETIDAVLPAAEPDFSIPGPGSPMRVLPKTPSTPETPMEDSEDVEGLPPGDLSAQQPSSSVGSALHSSGGCHPCAWFWKPGSCIKGPACSRCHLCPDGELKRRKKAKSVTGVCPSTKRETSSRTSLAETTREPAYVVCDRRVSFDADCPPGLFPTKVTVGGVPVKNTFINFDLPPRDNEDLGTTSPPTVSAPGALMSRLFRTTQRAPAPAQTYSDSPPTCSRGSHNSVDSTTTADILFSPPYAPDRPPGNLGPYNEPPLAPTGVVDPLPDAAATTTTTSVDDEVEYSGDPNSPMYMAHMRKECTPCNYFYYKADGCRQGGECQFCHLCPKGEIKKRKKERVKGLKARSEMYVAAVMGH